MVESTGLAADGSPMITGDGCRNAGRQFNVNTQYPHQGDYWPRFRRHSGQLVAPSNDGRDKGAVRLCETLSETEFFDDLKSIDVPVLVMHGEDDPICPFPASGAKSIKLVKHRTLKTYPGSRLACPRLTRSRSMPTCSNSSREKSWPQPVEHSRAAPLNFALRLSEKWSPHPLA